jgi:hypothetical protein
MQHRRDCVPRTPDATCGNEGEAPYTNVIDMRHEM